MCRNQRYRYHFQQIAEPSGGYFVEQVDHNPVQTYGTSWIRWSDRGDYYQGELQAAGNRYSPMDRSLDLVILLWEPPC
jgi:hypothetical protein